MSIVGILSVTGSCCGSPRSYSWYKGSWWPNGNGAPLACWAKSEWAKAGSDCWYN